jgi:hypothetical protein
MTVLIPIRAAQAQESDPCASNIPSPLIEIFEMKFAGWSPEQLSDLDPDDRQLWLKSSPRGCPGVAVGHFESPDRLDYAVLLVRHSDPTGGYKIVVFNGAPNRNVYTWKLVAHWDTSTYGAVVLSKAPPGRYSDYEDARISVTTKLDGILLEFVEKGAMLYYWTTGRYKYVRVSG